MNKNLIVSHEGVSQTPSPQDVDWWHDRHNQKCALKNTLERVDMVFLGDSITHAWEEDIPTSVWQSFYAHRFPLNLGFAGDRTEHLIWRIEHGELDGLSPKLVILSIGTNNTGHRLDPPEETAEAINNILERIKIKLPESKLLLLGLFPRSSKPTQRLRVINDEVNRLIQHFADNECIFYLDISPRFLSKNGLLTANTMQDFLHPNMDQYQIWAEAMEPTIQKLLHEDVT